MDTSNRGREGGAAMFLVLDKHPFVRHGTGVDAVLHHGPAEPFDLAGGAPRYFWPAAQLASLAGAHGIIRLETF